MLTIHDLRKSYGATPVLQGVSLEVRAGEIVGLVGPNGAGKTTLLKCIVDVAHADGGTIGVADVDARADSLAARRLIGYSPSETALYHRFRAVDLLRFSIGFHPQSDLSKGLTLLDELGVPRRRRVSALSHGMKRKILLAQAIASGAPLLVLDEPMEAFDPAARRIAIELLQDAASNGRAILCSSHDLTSTEQLCDRVVFLHGGCVLREGPTGTLLAEAGRLVHLTLRVPIHATDLPQHSGWDWSGSGTNWKLVHNGAPEDVLVAIATLPVASIRTGDGSLDEVFATLYLEQRP
jgi:ABC-2 type transport system ATP-binding protein